MVYGFEIIEYERLLTSRTKQKNLPAMRLGMTSFPQQQHNLLTNNIPVFRYGLQTTTIVSRQARRFILPKHIFFRVHFRRQNHLGRTQPRAATTATTGRSVVALVAAVVFLVASSRCNIMAENGPGKNVLGQDESSCSPAHDGGGQKAVAEDRKIISKKIVLFLRK